MVKSPASDPVSDQRNRGAALRIGWRGRCRPLEVLFSRYVEGGRRVLMVGSTPSLWLVTVMVKSTLSVLPSSSVATTAELICCCRGPSRRDSRSPGELAKASTPTAAGIAGDGEVAGVGPCERPRDGGSGLCGSDGAEGIDGSRTVLPVGGRRPPCADGRLHALVVVGNGNDNVQGRAV